VNDVASYMRAGDEIYARSFEIIRSEANLSRFSASEREIVVRMIHACGVVELSAHIEFGHDFSRVAGQCVRRGAAILCDAEMVAHGITRRHLPYGNDVICMLNRPGVSEFAQALETTRSAAALELWKPHLEGSIVAIGNAPTALFRLLELIHAGHPKPSAIIGIPVGFVGAAESKHGMATSAEAIPFLTVHGRMGGSAITAAVINAIAIGLSR